MHEREQRSHDLPVAQTTDFVCRFAPAGARVLELGCGDGRVAHRLAERGFRVTAIDADAAAVARARALGVEAECADWPHRRDETVDVVLFSRSLHHMRDPAAALAAAARTLCPQGRILIEDFAYDAAGDPALRWFVERLREGVDAGHVDTDADEMIGDLLAGGDRVAAWRRHHHEHVHGFAAISAAISAATSPTFADVRTFETPYLYRYLPPICESSHSAARWIEEVFEAERSMIEDGRLDAIGRRVVAGLRADGRGQPGRGPTDGAV